MPRTELVPRVRLHDVETDGATWKKAHRRRSWEGVRKASELTKKNSSWVSSLWRKIFCKTPKESPEMRLRFSQLEHLATHVAKEQLSLEEQVAFSTDLMECVQELVPANNTFWPDVKDSLQTLEQVVEAAKQMRDFKEAGTLIEQLLGNKKTLQYYRHSWERYEQQSPRNVRHSRSVNPKRRAQEMYETYCKQMTEVSDSLLADTTLRSNPIFDELNESISSLLIQFRKAMRHSNSKEGMEAYKRFWTAFSRWMTNA